MATFEVEWATLCDIRIAIDLMAHLKKMMSYLFYSKDILYKIILLKDLVFEV